MSTTQDEKPVKPRSRSRKADQKASKAGAKAQLTHDQVSVAADSVGVEAEPVSAMIAAAIEAVAAEVPQAEIVQAETAPADAQGERVSVAAVTEKASDAALSGEVLPPELRKALQTTSLSTIALAYGDYTRKSWAAGRSLVERLIAVRSFEEAIEVQGEFTKQAYENFIVHSQRICDLYGEWAQQFFRPYEKLATEWSRAAR